LILALAFVSPEKTLEEFDNLLFYFEYLQKINEIFLLSVLKATIFQIVLEKTTVQFFGVHTI
jgi:hypothetical protein